MALYNGAAHAYPNSMKKTLFLSLMLMIPAMTIGQIIPSISKIEVAGFPERSLSVDLRDSMQKLVGQRYDAETVDPILRRIETEQPDFLVATRTLEDTEPGRIRLVFVMAPKTPGAAADSNVNSQYIVESAEVKGVTPDQYSVTLHDEIQNMVGLMLDQMKVEDIRSRLRTEPMLKGKYSVSDKIERGSQPGQVKLIFEAKKMPWALRVTLGNKIDINGNGIHVGDIKDTDIVESVDVKGVARSAYSSSLDSELQLMVGKRVDHLEADHLKEKLLAELKDGYEISDKFQKGTKPNTVAIVYDAKVIPWIPERTFPEVGAYHPKQGISAFVDGNIYKGLTLGLGTDGDTLTERYKGYTAGYESRMLGTRYVGAKIRFSTFGLLWKRQTLELLDVSPEIPGAYRTRQAIEPSLAFALNRTISATAGFNFVELHMMNPQEHWESAHEATASFRYLSPKLKSGSGTSEITSGYEVRTAAHNLNSDFVYTRHYWDGGYSGKFGKNQFKFSYLAGRITGDPPLFERFSLGNTQTLRGWNKYDIDPIGGNRVYHFSTQWTYRFFGVFADNGSIWNSGDDAVNRSSIGVFLGPLKLAVPLGCSSNCGITFLVHID